MLAGGFVYFRYANDDEASEEEDSVERVVLQLNALSLSPGRTTIKLDKVDFVPPPVTMDYLRSEGRFSKVTLDALESRGMSHVAWINPGEHLPGIRDDDVHIWEHGAFMYERRNQEMPVTYVVAVTSKNRDMMELSTFERVARAAMISSGELNTVLDTIAKTQVEKNVDRHSHSGRLFSMTEVQDQRRSAVNASSLDEIQYKGIDDVRHSNHMSAIKWASSTGIPHAVINLLDNGATDIAEALELALARKHSDTTKALLTQCAAPRRFQHWLVRLTFEESIARCFPVRQSIVRLAFNAR